MKVKLKDVIFTILLVVSIALNWFMIYQFKQEVRTGNQKLARSFEEDFSKIENTTGTHSTMLRTHTEMISKQTELLEIIFDCNPYCGK